MSITNTSIITIINISMSITMIAVVAAATITDTTMMTMIVDVAAVAVTNTAKRSTRVNSCLKYYAEELF